MKAGNNLGYLWVGGNIILKWLLEKESVIFRDLIR